MERSRSTSNKETIEEMIGILTAISIVSKRMAARLTRIDKKTLNDEGKESKGIDGQE